MLISNVTKYKMPSSHSSAGDGNSILAIKTLIRSERASLFIFTFLLLINSLFNWHRQILHYIFSPVSVYLLI